MVSPKAKMASVAHVTHSRRLTRNRIPQNLSIGNYSNLRKETEEYTLRRSRNHSRIDLKSRKLEVTVNCERETSLPRKNLKKKVLKIRMFWILSRVNSVFFLFSSYRKPVLFVNISQARLLDIYHTLNMHQTLEAITILHILIKRESSSSAIRSQNRRTRHKTSPEMLFHVL